jgi:hypothetical protein
MTTTSNPHRPYGWDNPRQASWPQFALWVLIGPIMISGLLAAFTPLVLVTGPFSALLVVAMGTAGGMNASAFGALSGVGAGFLVITFWNPWPWLLVALCLVAAGIAGYISTTAAARSPHFGSSPAMVAPRPVQPAAWAGAWRVVGRAARYGAISGACVGGLVWFVVLPFGALIGAAYGLVLGLLNAPVLLVVRRCWPSRAAIRWAAGATSAVLGVATLVIFESHVRVSDVAIVAPVWAGIGVLVGPRVAFGKRPKKADSTTS